MENKKENITESKKIYIKQLRKDLYLLDEAHESTGYLLIGEKKACLIDTMQGYNDLKKVVEKLTDKPVMVINTHCHPDHIYGNSYFEKAYINPADKKAALEFANNPDYVKYLKSKSLCFPPFEDINDGDLIDLGGKTLKVFLLPGHTPGGILLLYPEERILFTGDSINHHLWMMVPGSVTIESFVHNLEKLMFLEKEADVILHGHGHDYDDISLMSALLNGAKEILSGKNQIDTPYEWFGGKDFYHPFQKDHSKHFQQEESGICYSLNNIFEKKNI